VETTIKNK